MLSRRELFLCLFSVIIVYENISHETHSITVIILESELGYLSSNPGQDYIFLSADAFGKGMNLTILPPATCRADWAL